MAQLKLTVVTPEEEVFNDEVDMVTVNTKDGEIGILPHHANLMAQLAPGEMRIKKGGKETVMAIGAGLLEVTSNTLIIATDLAENLEDIDEKIVEEARKRAEAALEQTQSDEEYATAMANLEKALAQLKVKRRHRTR